MDIGEAITATRRGAHIRRPGWKPGITVWFVPAEGRTREHLMIVDQEAKIFPWTPGSWDLLAGDYEIAEGTGARM